MAIAATADYVTIMNSLVDSLVPIAITVVAIILALGMVNMMRGGNPNRSQRLMRWRVGLQFVAIIVIMAAVYFSGR